MFTFLSSLTAEGKRRNEFAEWHVAWLAERHNLIEEFNLWKMAQRNKLKRKACARVSAVPSLAPNLKEQSPG